MALRPKRKRAPAVRDAPAFTVLEAMRWRLLNSRFGSDYGQKNLAAAKECWNFSSTFLGDLPLHSWIAQLRTCLSIICIHRQSAVPRFIHLPATVVRVASPARST
jgi:hypothetical protein